MAEENESKNLKQPEKPLLEWSSPDSVSASRDSRWYIVVGGAVLILAALLAYIGNWTGMALVIVGGVIMSFLSNTKAHSVECAVYDKGIVVDEKVHEFSEFKSFWVSGGEVPKIRLQFAGRFAGQVMMPILNVDGDKVKELLIKHLPEEADKGEDLTDMINRIMRF